MHISLDQAIGRQPRLNRVGQSILNIGGDASAAYSLRSLTGGDPKVVRVRRASDNQEQDFTASGVSSGALQDFVNAQVTAPLDIQALTATGRDGNFLISNAAYSLRSLGTRQATLAATGDTVARTDGKFVAQVRRNVDGNLKSFTADEVTDGTLLSFVNESFTSSLPLDVQGSAAAAYSLRKVKSDYTGPAVRIRRTSDDIDADVAFDTNDTVSNNSIVTEVLSGNQSTLQAFISGTNAAVATWYDQSGSSKNATQTTDANQPLIASGGSLLTDGVKFSLGTNLKLSGTGLDIFKNTQHAQVFYVIKINDTSTALTGFFEAQNNASQSRFLLRNSNATAGRVSLGGRRLDGDSFSSFQSDSGHSNEKVLLTAFVNYSDTDAFIFQNGTQIGSDTSFLTAGATSDTRSTNIAIGRASSNNTAEFDAEELIIFNTDQTNKRRAIEESIATNYGITLSSFDRDGFVKTWYDQSVTTQAGDTATGNHATQATDSLQPKIVGDGLLLKDTNQNPAIEFKRLADIGSLKLILDTPIPPMGTTNFAVVDYRRSFSFHLAGLGGGTIRIGRYSSNQFRIVNGGATVVSTDTSFTTDAVHLATANIAASGGTSKAFVDGVEVISNDFSDATDNFEQIFRGDNDSDNPIFVSELIIYASDQTDNRTAIEANLGEVYGINLPSGVDPLNNEVDGFVNTWYDQSGNSRNATAAADADQPKIVSGGSLETGATGKPTINFDAASEHFLSASVATTQPFTTTIQFNGAKSTVAGSTLQNLIDSQSSSQSSFIQIQGEGELIINHGSALDSGRDLDSFGESVIISVANGSSSSIDFNGATQVTGNAGTNNRDAIRIGRHRTNSGNYFNGDMSELLIHNSQLSNSTIDTLESNIISHYNITEI